MTDECKNAMQSLPKEKAFKSIELVATLFMALKFATCIVCYIVFAKLVSTMIADLYLIVVIGLAMHQNCTFQIEQYQNEVEKYLDDENKKRQQESIEKTD